jgi:hexulose-6-phosphate isomerase
MLKQALREAKTYGAPSVLLVPAVVNETVSFDDAWKRSTAEIRQAIPLAEELGVKISLENVWNNFLLNPIEAARYVDQFQSPAVKWHLDIGNVVRYGCPEQWVRILGPRIQTLHFKEFSRTRAGQHRRSNGLLVNFFEGDNNWPGVMKALAEINYSGWAVAEQYGAFSLKGLDKISRGMDQIFAS